jgi:hypothetical protein
MSDSLARMIERAKDIVDNMTPEELEEMRQRQRAGWVKAELQWAKDFREGKVERD